MGRDENETGRRGKEEDGTERERGGRDGEGKRRRRERDGRTGRRRRRREGTGREGGDGEGILPLSVKKMGERLAIHGIKK